MSKQTINLSAMPYTPPGWSVKTHEVPEGMSKWEWNPEEMSLYLSEDQRSRQLSGEEMRAELLSRKSMNANVLDFLLANKELTIGVLRKEAHRKVDGFYIFFWGTIYRHVGGYDCVRYLWWDGGAEKPISRYFWIDASRGFGPDDPAAIFSLANGK